MRYYLFLLSYFFVSISFAQQALTIEQCEELFLKNNLMLLAEQYNIDAAKANIIQAKIWDLPYISGEFNLLNPQYNKVLDAGKQGEKTIAIQQLIYLGGKKKHEVDFAKSNLAIAELQYEQLLRSLKLQLSQSFYELYFSQKKVKSISFQIQNLDTLINEYNVQSIKGNISLKDVVRLQSLSLSFKNQLIDIQKNNIEQLEKLKLLISTQDDIDVIINEETILQKLSNSLSVSKNELQDKTLEKNTEYLTSLKMIENADLMLRWQKSLAVNDLTLGANYDQRGGAFNNQVNITFGIPLPLWNKNKGNIQIAKAQVNQSLLMKDQKIQEVKSKVSSTYNLFIYQQNQYKSITSNFKNFEIVYNGTFKNFQRRNISLLEFTDFMESYNESVLFLNEMTKQLIISGETLNYLTNQKIF